MSKSDNTSPDAELTRAIRARYIRAFLTPANITLLVVGILANLLYRFAAFNWLSDKLHIYQSMAAVIFCLSIDVYLLVLYSVSDGVFRKYTDAGIFRDLYAAGLRSWQIFSPMLQVLTLLIFADAIVETCVSSLTAHEPGRLPLLGFIASLIFSAIVSLFLACFFLVLSLRRTQRLVGYVLVIVISYITAAALSWFADRFEPMVQRWGGKGNQPDLANVIDSATGSSSHLFSSIIAGYMGQTLIGIIMLALLPVLYMYTRKLAEKRFAQIAGARPEIA